MKAMGKTIGITYNLKEEWKSNPADPVDASAELDKPQTIEELTRAIEAGGHRVEHIGNVHHLISRIHDHDLDVDIILNLCEGMKGRNRESEVPLILELYDIPFIGADALTLGVTLDKVMAKKCFIADGIPTPKYFFSSGREEIEHLNSIGFPLIVKTRHEGSSKGLTNQSKVKDYPSLIRQIRVINNKYHQTALVEEFIRGTEFTVAVLGNNPPEAMPVVQISIDGHLNLGEEFYTFERLASAKLKYVCPAKISSELAIKLQDLAVRAYGSVDCRDFGRVDFRVDEKGNPYVLEINPLPVLAKEDVFNFFPKVIGSSYEEVINKVIYFGLKRYGLNDGPFIFENKTCSSVERS